MRVGVEVVRVVVRVRLVRVYSMWWGCAESKGSSVSKVVVWGVVVVR